MTKEKRAIKFYLNKSVNKSKKDKILKFLSECNLVENQLLTYYWNNFDIVIKSKTKIDFIYNNKINFKDITPQLKSHHFQSIIQQVYEQMKSIQSKIINKKIRFKFKDDTNKQRIYNYCKQFCFDWDKLEKYNKKQLNKFKKKDEKYHEFLLLVKDYINDDKLYSELKQDIENKFWEEKAKFKLPNKTEFQIRCSSFNSVDIKLKEFEWLFNISNNDRIGGTEKKGIYDKIIIPVKFSNYHKQKLKDKKLASTFNLKLNNYGRIEIIGCYEVEVDYSKNDINNEIGIDIGFKKLITSSDGEIIEQNDKIIKMAKRVLSNQHNRDGLEYHLKEKYNNRDFKLPNKRHKLLQAKLSNFVKSDNRFKIKQFLNGRENYHIIMEELELAYNRTYNREVNYLMKRIGIQSLKSDIEKYCKKYGINISTVNPAYTSQQCPVCGYVNKKSRKTQERFLLCKLWTYCQC